MDRWDDNWTDADIPASATTHYSTPSSGILCERWFDDKRKIMNNLDRDILHRIYAPAVLKYLNDGTLAEEQWWHSGRKHRGDGPAIIRHTERMKPIQYEWWYLGERYFFAEWLVISELSMTGKVEAKLIYG